MGKKIFCFLTLIIVSLSFISLILISSLVSAVPGYPHWFYGSVEVNGKAVPDNTVIIAKVEADQYTSVTKNSNFGYSPNTFYVEDPDGNRAGKTIDFYVDGKKADSYIFENNGYTELTFSLTTTCGDGYCLGDETCSSCQRDCGQCTGPPTIIINSPENKKYEILKIPLEVSSNQEILVWMYALNSVNFITFIPNITITAIEGDNNLTILAINKVYQTGTNAVSFSVELPKPFCGDGACNSDIGESCSTCSQDCGNCPNPNTGGGGGGDTGGGGGGSINTTSKKNETKSQSLVVETPESGAGEETSNEQTASTRQGTSGITGAVIGTVKRNLLWIAIGFIALIFVLALIVGIVRRRKRKKR